MSEKVVIAKINDKIEIFNHDKDWNDKVVPFITANYDDLENLKLQIEFLLGPKNEALNLCVHKRETVRP